MNFDNLIKKYNLKIKGVIHIGAHVGSEYLDYKKHNITNLMFFEPIPEIFMRLKDNVGETNAKLYNIALGNKVGKQIIHFGSNGRNDSCSSMLEPETFLEKYPDFNFDIKFEVTIDKLDNIEYDRDDYNFINIDVQGYELEVFKGSIESLENIDYILTEINEEHLYKDGVLTKELDLFLSDFDFVRVETYLVEGKGWGDALYIKNNN